RRHLRLRRQQDKSCKPVADGSPGRLRRRRRQRLHRPQQDRVRVHPRVGGKMRFALILLFAGAAYADLKSGDRARDFESKTLKGETVKLSQLRGKVVLLDFWASWCEPCKKELPLLAKMAPRLKEQGVEIVAVNIDEKKDNAEAFLKEHGLN